MAHSWAKLGIPSDPKHQSDFVTDAAHNLYYRGHEIKEAWYRGHCVWKRTVPSGIPLQHRAV